MRLLSSLSLAVLLMSVSPAAQDEVRQRVRIAHELGKQDSSAIGSLGPMLRDPSLEVRIEAVKSLVAIGTVSSLDPLIEATRDNDPEIQIRATDGLVNFYLPGYVESGLSASLKRAGTALLSHFTDVNDKLIDAYLEVRPEVIQALAALVRGGASMEARANAARAAGILRGSTAVPALIGALRTKDDQVLYESLVALQKIRDYSAGPMVMFLIDDLAERVQVAALETVGLLHTREAVPGISDVLRRTASKKVRRAALGALALIADPATRPLFTQYLRDSDDALRAAAAEGLGRLRNPDDRPALETLFVDEHKMSPRLSAAFALVLAGRTEWTEFSPLAYLVNTLNAKSYRGVAQPFLIELTRDPGIRRSLETLLPRATKDEKIGLAQVLASSGDKQSMLALDPLTRDPDADVASEAIRAVRTLKARFA